MAKTPFRGTRGRRILGDGPTNARLVVVGEAPGADEEDQGRPFVGASGRFLWEVLAGWPESGLLTRLGCPRERVRRENVVELRPLDNEMLSWTPEQVGTWQTDFHGRMTRLEGTRVLAPVGNVALNTLLRLPLPVRKKGGWRTKKIDGRRVIDWPAKIGQWRGSVFWYVRDDGVRVRVMPTFHPAYVLRNGNVWDVWQDDWRRIVADLDTEGLGRRPRVTSQVDADIDVLEGLAWEVEVAGDDDVVVADIETAGATVLCIGLALVKGWQQVDQVTRIQPVVVPLTPDQWPDAKVSRAWQLVRRILASNVPKAFHYGVYDTYVLRKGYGIKVRNWLWDTQQMHHALDPRDRHTLAYVASRFLRVKFWKDEGKEEQGNTKTMTRDAGKLRRYCGKDVGYTAGILVAQHHALVERGLLRHYIRNYRNVTEPCVDLAIHGFRVDEKRRVTILKREIHALAALTERLDREYGDQLRTWWKANKGGTDGRLKKIRLVAKTGLSNAYLATLVYDVLGCRWRGMEPRSVKELRLRQLCRKFPVVRPLATIVFSFQQHKKVAEFAAGGNVDPDGRMRSLWTPTTKTGRLRSRGNALGGGRNQQNNPRSSDLRSIFVPEPGQVLVEVDLSQAEDRLVGGMSGDRELMALAQASPLDVDVHRLNADLIFRGRETDLSPDEQRQVGKKTKHALNYDEGPQMMADTLLVETEGRLVVSPDECKEFIDVLDHARPGTRKYQAWVRQQMIETRTLRSAWGADYRFTGLRLSAQDFKEGYAYLAQEGVGRLMNRRGFVPLGREIGRQGRRSRIVHQGHDSLAVSSPPAEAWEVVAFLVGSLSRPKTYPGAGGPWSLGMPCSVKVGANLKAMVEWKVLPDRDAFAAEVEKVMRAGVTGRVRA